MTSDNIEEKPVSAALAAGEKIDSLDQQSVLDLALFFMQMTEYIEDVFWISSPDLKTLHFISKGYERIWGKTCQSLHDDPLSFLDSILPDDRENMIKAVEQALESQGSFDMEYRIIGANGDLRWIWSRGFPIKDMDGNIYRSCGLAQDITERKHKEELLTKVGAYKQIFESVNDSIFVHDVLTGDIVYVNQKTCDLLGYDRDEICAGGVGLFSSGIDPYTSEYAAKWIKKAVEEGPQLFEWECVSKDGLLIPSEVNLKLAEVEGEERILAIVRDITERRKAQSAAFALARERHNRKQAIRASQLKSRFVANISHELRTPLAAIIGFNELLLSTGLTDEQKELVQLIDQSSHGLLTLVNDVLDLSKIEAGRAEIRSTNFGVCDSVNAVASLMNGPAQEKKLSLETSCDSQIPSSVVGDPDRLHQILVNLVNNGIKFTDSGSVSLSAKLEIEDEGFVVVRFEVTDTGIGISDEDMTDLFLPYSQIDSSDSRKHGGTGLGLSISKNYVEMMGGELGCNSKVKEGSNFWFVLPFKRGDDSSGSAESGASISKVESLTLPEEAELLSSLNVLVVDDNAYMSKLVMQFLSIMKIDAGIACDGSEAVEACRKSNFDVILMDCQMPTMDGFAATKAIRELEQKSGHCSKIIAMTASAMLGDRENCLNAGMNSYISKPFTIDELKDAILKCVKS